MHSEATTLRIVRHTRGKRLIARAMVLVLALVTVWGSSAFACHDSHHSAALEFAALHHADEGGMSAAHGSDTSEPSHTPNKSGHPCCADLMCHGGVAIVAAGFSIALPAPNAEAFVILDQIREGLHLASLDRPPRATVQV